MATFIKRRPFPFRMPKNSKDSIPRVTYSDWISVAMTNKTSHSTLCTQHQLTRRALLKQGVVLGATATAPFFGLTQHAHAEAPKEGANPALPTRHQLIESEFVYVSPLHESGGESTCHGEVWYAWLDDSVVLITAKTTWKARALGQGLATARIWVGNHGRWKGWFTNNEAFRKAPKFDARVETDNDPALLDRLMGVYKTKYPAEFSDWEAKQRSGFHSGERIILRYFAQ